MNSYFESLDSHHVKDIWKKQVSLVVLIHMLLKAKYLIATLKILQQLLTRTLPNIW